MKRKILLAVSAVALVFTSCNRDEENEGGEKKVEMTNFIGEWKIELDRYEYSAGNIDRSVSGCEEGNKVVFENGKDYNEMIIKTADNRLVNGENQCFVNADTSIPFVVENGNLYVYKDYYNDKSKVEIWTLDENTFDLKFEWDFDNDGIKESRMLSLKR